MKILADKNIPYLKGVFEPFVEVDYMAGQDIVSESLVGVDVLIIRTRTICNKELLEGSEIKLIATATIGYDHIDTNYCSENGIKWVTAPGCNAKAVQQWVMSAILFYARENNLDITKQVLGVVGVGNVGEKVVEFAEAIGMPVILNDPPREDKEGKCVFRSFETIKKECDIITFHVPLAASGKHKTLGMLNRKTLGDLRQGVLLLNSSRGEVIKGEALINAIRTGSVKDAMLDVWEGEPILDNDLLGLTYIGTSHIAGYSSEGKANGTAAVVNAVAQYYDIPLEDWYPEEMLNADKRRMHVNCVGKSLQEIITEAVLQTYSINDDNTRLKNNPSDFELYRSTYNYRNEPQAWIVELKNANDGIIMALKEIGFNVEPI